jgi:hypothetical protein
MQLWFQDYNLFLFNEASTSTTLDTSATWVLKKKSMKNIQITIPKRNRTTFLHNCTLR